MWEQCAKHPQTSIGLSATGTTLNKDDLEKALDILSNSACGKKIWKTSTVCPVELECVVEIAIWFIGLIKKLC